MNKNEYKIKLFKLWAKHDFKGVHIKHAYKSLLPKYYSIVKEFSKNSLLNSIPKGNIDLNSILSLPISNEEKKTFILMHCSKDLGIKTNIANSKVL